MDVPRDVSVCNHRATLAAAAGTSYKSIVKPAPSDALVFFGATGDLAYKQIYPALQALVRRGRLDVPIVAIGRKDLPVAEIVARAKDSVTKAGGFDAATFAKLSALFRYVQVDYDDPATFARIRHAIPASKHPLHYVALPPEVYEAVATNLAKAGLNEGGRLTLEKPFGHDAASARALSELLYKYFPEEAIFRIDHFLGKESVENIVYFRAANPLIEAGLSRDHVDYVEITMAETFGVKGRAKFYDDVGAVRDVVQNHLLEVVACLAMELPQENAHDQVSSERSRLIGRIRALANDDIVRGQVRGYTNEDGVRKDSTTETFAVLRLAIDSPRWQGVPFFIRTGKSLPVTATEAIVRWKAAQLPVLDERSPPAPNHVRFRIGPDRVIAVGANVKKDGEAMVGVPKELVLLRTAADDAGQMSAYERLLGDAMQGEKTLFARKDAVEESWRVVDPIVSKKEVFAYDAGTWGPAEAQRIAPPAGWSNPK
jgi:glucose-6-phosphate 1-dehydrogenase